MTSPRPPFPPGDPRAAEAGRRGGQVSGEVRRQKAAARPNTQHLLDQLGPLSTNDWFDRLGYTEPSWAGHRMIGQVLDGLPLDVAQMALYLALSGRQSVPARLMELLLMAGRGVGKTTGLLAVQAVKGSVRRYVVRGNARILFLAFGRDQAGVGFELYAEHMEKDPDLRRLITRRTKDEITLAHGVTVQTISSDYRRVRAYSVALALCDEVAFWWNDTTASNPAAEVLRALRPGLGKVAGARLLMATSPWTQEGPVYDMHERYFGKEADHVLVLRASTLQLNPSFDAARIAMEEQEDPESAASEYGAAWRVAGGTLVSPAAYDACVDRGVVERAPEPPLGDDYYSAAVDLSGGTGADSAALSIQHVDVDDGTKAETCVLDLVREWAPPFDPPVMVAEVAAHCARYGVTEVVGDQFSEGFAASEFRRHGITYVVSGRKTGECALDSLAVINGRRVRLLDVPRLRKQWLNLKRDYASGGRPTILETRRHDDVAICTARGIVAALGLGEEPVVKRAVLFG